MLRLKLFDYSKLTIKIPKSYLRLASVYRRFVGRHENLDFSIEALIECFEHESLGRPVKKYYGTESHKNNGYVLGKWAKDISVTTWKEDILNGYMCKAEFTYGINSWWATKALDFSHNTVWFPYAKEYR
jgi:hypothetical protein